ncbi:HAD family hydrolase [Verrucomicrobium spinosum]|uniref:HAD family hydrolase n=1 Tax=Verrucomicrobium spinosum TaxID=2736 RepID=UPI000AA76A44|nr:HAD family hydrolase [Verrucomicrobium spinosum]
MNVVAMDKTGTLTEGELRVTNVESFPPGRETEVARLAFTLDGQSNHPISRAITTHGKSLGLEPYPVTEFQRLTGAGLRGRVNGEICYVGRRELMEQGDFAQWLDKIPDTPLGYSEVWVLSLRAWAGSFCRTPSGRAAKACWNACMPRGCAPSCSRATGVLPPSRWPKTSAWMKCAPA